MLSIPNIWGYFSTNKDEEKAITEEQKLEAALIKDWTTQVKGGFSALTIWSIVRIEPVYATLFFLACLGSNQIARFSYDHRHNALAAGKWIAKSAAQQFNENIAPNLQQANTPTLK